MGLLHVRLLHAPDDFILLSPLLDTKEADDKLGHYKCNREILSWYFCKACGVRCFTVFGEGELVDIDVDEWMGKEAKGQKTKVWRPKKDSWNEFKKSFPFTYLSVNALTLDQGQEGLDLREWCEKKWMYYVDHKEGAWKLSTAGPFERGTY